MFENICRQCRKVPTRPHNRLVQDSCGHQKCRECLLEDDEQCRQCEDESIDGRFNTKIAQVQVAVCDRNGDIESEFLTNNHAGVIQVNGNVSKYMNVSEVDEIKHIVDDEPEHQSVEAAEDVFHPDVDVEGVNCKLEENVKKKDKRSYQAISVPVHIRVISDPLSYHCTICDKTFITKTHIKYHTYCAGRPKPFQCDICHKEFILRAQLDVHSYKHKNNRPHVCQICNKSFSDKSKLTRHSVVHSTVKSHICSTCGNAYRSKESLRLHSITHKSEKPYKCKLCTARFNNASNLNKHSVTHSKEKSHMCDQCGKRFKQKLSLSVHRKTHLRIREYECDICLKSFVNNKDLRRHGLIHAETTGYACGICKTSFRRKDNLQRHMKNTHPGKTGDAIIKSVVLPPTTARKPTPPVDNPNAINVITSVPPTVVESDCRAAGSGVAGCCPKGHAGIDERLTQQQTVINGPIKLAFKTPAFKSSYNIIRNFNYVPPSQCPDTHDMAESIDICQKILSTDGHCNMTPPRNIICQAGPTSAEMNPKIYSQHGATTPLHYETSFQNRKHAMIKNIKFKVPEQYTSNFRSPARNESKDLNSADDAIGVTSVIVNNNVNPDTNMHWRRRTSQNLGLKY